MGSLDPWKEDDDDDDDDDEDEDKSPSSYRSQMSRGSGVLSRVTPSTSYLSTFAQYESKNLTQKIDRFFKLRNSCRSTCINECSFHRVLR